ncbi:MAG: hypothetical protein QOF60_1178 [Actinomycetota bacterium]|nr:hypothetical protein [Actinomycetota bacterium]
MSAAGRKLTVDDIADLRAYERERPEFRERIIAMKKTRRVGVGPIITLMFENRDTMRFQIQEMARAEKILSDDAIAHEVATYNALIPEPGQLSATLFLELTSKMQLVEWLPKLVGIERSVELVIGEGAGSAVVTSIPEEAHEEQLTRPDATASVHYVRFELTPDEVERFAAEPVVLAVNHPHYVEGVPLSGETKAALLTDLRPE